MGTYNSLPLTSSLASRKLLNNSQKFIIISTITLVAFFCVLLAYTCDIKIKDGIRIHKHAFYTNLCNNKNNISDHNMTAQPTTTISGGSSGADDELRILIGIITVANRYQSRDMLRRVYHVQPRPSGVQVDLKFIFCNLWNEEEKILIPFEIVTHDDIIILNCTENMNEGKTYTYFSSLPEIFSDTGVNPPYHYVMKADDDTFVHVKNFAESLKPLPRDDLYYGFTMPCESMTMHGDYMAGFGYVMSWDLVKWISESEIPKSHSKGIEDMAVGEWLKRGNKGNNNFNMKWKMYDYPSSPDGHRGCAERSLSPDTIAIHQLKSQDKWIHTLSYFNLTQNLLNPSKLYSI